MKNRDFSSFKMFQATDMMACIAYPAKSGDSAKENGDCQLPPTKREGGTIQNVAWTGLDKGKWGFHTSIQKHTKARSIIMFLSRKGAKEWGLTKGKKGVPGDQMEHWIDKQNLRFDLRRDDDFQGRQWRHGLSPGNHGCQVIYGKITLCDLAGSERVKKSEVSRCPTWSAGWCFTGWKLTSKNVGITCFVSFLTSAITLMISCQIRRAGRTNPGIHPSGQ